MRITLHAILRARAVFFVTIALASLIWTILLSVNLFVRSDAFSAPETSVCALLTVAHSVTSVLLLILLTMEFRIWLDMTRMLGLLVMHIAFAVIYATHYGSFPCTSLVTDPDRGSVCQLFDLLILIGNCLTPALLLFYAACLAAFNYLCPHELLASVEDEFESKPFSNKGRISGVPVDGVPRPFIRQHILEV